MLPHDTAPARRTPAHVAFRFCLVYFGVYVLSMQMAGAMLPAIGRALDGLVTVVGARVFHVDATRHPITGSGDTLFNWVQTAVFLFVAAAGTVVWSFLDRPLTAYPRLHRWFRVFLRFALGATLLGYGVFKVFPLQMPAPSLTRLVEPFGQFSPMGVLWASIGASPWYERFCGAVELAAALLLFIPRTATAGALLALAATVQVFVLNMTYDVPVKLFSFHLVAMSAFLLAPDAPRLAAALFATGARSRWAAMAQTAFGVLLVTVALIGARTSAGQIVTPVAAPLRGIWGIDVMRVDGADPPSGGGLAHWRDVVIDSPRTIAFVRTDDSVVSYGAGYDVDRQKISVAAGGSAGSFDLRQIDADHLTFDGAIGIRAIHLETTRRDADTFPLLGDRFHWIQEVPVNR